MRTCVNPAALNERFSRLESVSILGGNNSLAQRFSYWAAEAKEIFEFRSGDGEPFEKLERVLGKYKLDGKSGRELPGGIFCGGWIGYFGYELGRYIERLPQTTMDDLSMPLVRLSFYDRVICYDHIEKRFRLIALQLMLRRRELQVNKSKQNA